MQKSKKPWQLIVILLVTLVPIVAAYVAYYTGIGVPDETVNNGTLISPALDAKSLDGEPQSAVPAYSGDGMWRILIPIAETCGTACQQNLYVTRQVHIRLANKAGRVERYAINLGGEQGQSYLDSIAAEHPGLKQMQVDTSLWRQWVDGSNLPADLQQTHFYLLVDPLGFAMMYYTADNDGNQLLDDLKRILRYSPED